MPPKRKKSLVDLSTESPAPDDNFDVASVASIPSTASATPVKPKAKKPKVEKADKVEKVKAPPKPKAPAKEKAPPKEKEDKKEGKEVKGKTIVKEAKETKVIGKDGKEKVKAVTGDEAQEVLMEYLTRENRPFSAGDVSGNLHGKVTKTLTDKLLKELANSGLINGKGTNGDGKGSQWVYWPLQDPNFSLSPEELANMDAEIEDLRATMPELRMEVKKLGIKLAGMKNEIGVTELKERIRMLEEGRREKEGKLAVLRDAGAKVVKKEEVDRVDREFVYWSKMRGVRKRGFQAVEGALLEGMSREDIWEKAGIEGDED